MTAVAQVLEQAKARHDAVRTIVHGTTLATNAIIERKGARTALLTTRGFRDVLETGTELRYDLHDLFIEFPEPLVPRHRRIGIAERVRFDGSVLTPLDEAEVAALCGALERRTSRRSPFASCTPTPIPANEDAGGSGDPGRAAGSRRVAVLARAAGDRRVRSRLHHGGQRLRPAADVALSGRALRSA